MPDTMASPSRVVIPFEEYACIRALSYSGMRDLAISPLRFWYKHINPDRPPDEPSKEMILGSALHCAVLEPGQFDDRYARLIDESDFPVCLRTIGDCREFIASRGGKARGTLKAEVIAQVEVYPDHPPILDVELERFAVESEGKTVLGKDEWLRVANAARALAEEPAVIQILESGRPEMSYFVIDRDTGVPLKARMDWTTPALTLDLKTFKASRDKSIDRAVADAIWYEGYHRQAYTYTHVRRLCGETADFLIAFVESEQPHETRLKRLRPRHYEEANIYWEQARAEVRRLINLYADCVQRWGDRPWTERQKLEPLVDEDMPQVYMK